MTSGIDEWLTIHDLVEYRRAFAEHEIRLSDLPLLTEDDLKELGLPIGPRRRAMAAIAKLGADRPAPQVTSPGKTATDGPEVRHLTLMFADLVGSTKLSEEMDIEAYRDLIHDYQVTCSHAVRRHHGHLAQFIGDGVVAYFGYPGAGEDDAERAVLAGLEVCRMMAERRVPGRDPVQVRIGIATGDVVIDARDNANVLAFGEAPNLAARIQQVTAPGTVAVSDETRSLLGVNFTCDLIGEREFKGFSRPARIWTVREAREPALRFQSRQHGTITPMVGREAELLLLEKRWQAATRNGAQVVILSGEAGIGKSRLAEELDARIPRDTRQRLSFQCLPNHEGSSLHPVIGAINNMARISRTDTGAQRLEKLRRWLSGVTDRADALYPVFAHLLSIPMPSVPDQSELPPEQMKAQLQEAIVALLRELAGRKPLLILFEDLHWIDPSTEELIDLLFERLQSAPVLMVCTTRPDYQPRWQGLANVTSLTVSRLDMRHARQLLRSLIEQLDMPPDLESRIIAKTDGVPLFLEEMTRMVRQRLEASRSGQGIDHALALPATLKDLLRAQIDNLATPRDFVSVCAAIGRPIIPAMLQAVSGEPDETFKRYLDQLVDAQILVRRRVGEGANYFFRHALIQDAIYELMLPSRARRLHLRIAETVSEQFPEIAARMPEQVAHHFALSGQHARARNCWRAAAERAARRTATEETLNHLHAALAENARIEDEDERDTHELALRRLLNVALNTHAFGSIEVRDNRDRLHQLLRKTGASAHDMFMSLIVRYGTQLMLGDTSGALELCREMEGIATATEDPTQEAMVAHSMGMTCFMMGTFDEAIRYFDKALQAREAIDPEEMFAVYAADIQPVDTAMRVWAQVCSSGGQGDLDGALRTVEQEPHDFSQCFALSILAAAQQMSGDVEAVASLSAAALEISERRKFQYWKAWSAILHGWAVARSGDPPGGIDELTRGIDDYLATGSTQMSLYARTLLADAWRVAGDHKEGLAIIEAVRADPLARTIRYQSFLTDFVEAALNSAADPKVS